MATASPTSKVSADDQYLKYNDARVVHTPTKRGMDLPKVGPVIAAIVAPARPRAHQRITMLAAFALHTKVPSATDTINGTAAIPKER
jgi:hypothetical protein